MIGCASATVAKAQDASPVPSSAAVASPAPSPGPLLVDRIATDPADVVRARVGQTFAIALRANRATGFAWQLAEPPAPCVETVGSAYETRTAGIGGGGQQFWLFRAIASGDAMLTLIYVRPSEKGLPLMERAETFRVSILP